ncbi:MAG TPA: YncE family protein [Vicinamibacterales bacterium]|nr:YncE family protein [Vicinamibacterales bacterium]
MAGRRAMVAIGLALVGAAATVVLAQTASSPILLVAVRTNKGFGALQMLDPIARRPLASVPTGEDPHGVAASTDGRFAYVANDMGCSISVIDLIARKEVRRVDLGPGSRPHDVRFIDGRLYFTLEGFKAIGRLDAGASKMDWVLGTGQNGTHMLAISSDLRRIFTANNGSNTVSAIERGAEASAPWNVTVIPIPKAPEGIDIAPDGREVWVASKDDGGGLSVIDVVSKHATPLGSVATTHANRVAFTPDGKLVLVRDGQGFLIVLDATTRTEVKRIALNTTSILVEPNGSRAYATVHPDNHVAVVDLKTLAVIGRIELGSGLDPDEMAWVAKP